MADLGAHVHVEGAVPLDRRIVRVLRRREPGEHGGRAEAGAAAQKRATNGHLLRLRLIVPRGGDHDPVVCSPVHLLCQDERGVARSSGRVEPRPHAVRLTTVEEEAAFDADRLVPPAAAKGARLGELVAGKFNLQGAAEGVSRAASHHHASQLDVQEDDSHGDVSRGPVVHEQRALDVEPPEELRST